MLFRTSDAAGQHVRTEPHEAEAAWVGRDDVRRIPGQCGMAEHAADVEWMRCCPDIFALW